ncbi:MAG: hypothetical protein H6643_14260 [Caldilineaceae bacterium]|nr:hypothetical protein [Caldilineaceae bacterium]
MAASGAADNSGKLAAVLVADRQPILAGTQIFYLKDFLNGSDYYRMNTLFKFFSQVWVIWAWQPRWRRDCSITSSSRGAAQARRVRRYTWGAGFCRGNYRQPGLPIFGTPSRVDQRMPGWRPEVGTLQLRLMREDPAPGRTSTSSSCARMGSPAMAVTERAGCVIQSRRRWSTIAPGSAHTASNTGLSRLRAC